MVFNWAGTASSNNDAEGLTYLDGDQLMLTVERLEDALRSDLDVSPPALIKGYLKCGGKVLGPPAWDPDFGTADLPMMMNLADLPAAYRRRLLQV